MGKVAFLIILGRAKLCFLLAITDLESDSAFSDLLVDEDSSSMQVIGRLFRSSEGLSMNYILIAHASVNRPKNALSRS